MVKSGGNNVNAGKEFKFFMKNRMWHEHWYVLVAIGGIVIALFAGAFVQFSFSKDHVYRLEVTDRSMMKRVFQSGDPWVVLCIQPDDLIPEVFTKATTRMTQKSFVGVLDCTQALPSSGKTILARYGIKTSISPTIFTVANGEKPKQIFLNYLQSSKALTKRVYQQTKKTIREIQNSSQLDAQCLQRSICILLLRGNKWKSYEKPWIGTLMNEYRTIPFAWIDASMLQLSIESMLPPFVSGEHRLVLFKKQRDTETKKTTISAKAYRNLFDLIPVQQFLKEYVNRSLKTLSKTPSLSRRKTTNEKKKNTYKKQTQKANEDERSDDYYFPQAVDEEENTTPLIQESIEEVIDLDE